MNTFAYALIAVGFIILAAGTRGRKFTDLPGDLTDLAVGLATFDVEQVTEVLERKGTPISSTSGFTGELSGDGIASGIGTIAEKVGTSGKSPDDLYALGKALEKQGLRISGNSRFGRPPSPGAHMVGSWHYKHNNSGAIDINHPNSSVEARVLDALVGPIRQQGFHVLWRVKGHYNHMHVDISRRDI